MIQAREDMVWVQHADGRLEPFDAAVLIASICAVNHTAAVAEGLLTAAESVADAIHRHACDHLAAQRITTGEIVEIVESLLEMLGYEAEARAYRVDRRSTEIRLDEIADRTSTGFILAFYREIDEALARAQERGSVQLRMSGLRACVLKLSGARRWGMNCKRLADEIVDHVVARAARDGAGEALQLAVVE